MSNIAFGKYLLLDSIIHHMDLGVKIGVMLIMTITILVPVGYAGYGVIAAVVIRTTLLAHSKLSFLWKAVKPMLFMPTFPLIINLLAICGGDVLFTIFGFSAYTGAVAQTLYVVIRLALMIMTTTTLTTTTKLLELTLEIGGLFGLFQVIHIPAHEIVMMIPIALRLIPTLIEETQRTMKAQVSRGVDMEEGNLVEKVRAVLSLIVPLFVSAFQRVGDLAYTMEAKGYIPNHIRTRCKQLKMESRDYTPPITSILAFTVMAAIMLYAQV